MRKTLIDIASRFFLTRKVLFCAPFLLVVTLALSVVAARPPAREDVQAGEQCIMCHITTFNAALGKNFLHTPFFQKQCTLCHLPAGVQSTDSVQQNTTLTASVVSQKELWRKQLSFSASTSPGLDHLTALSSLDLGTAYRFRIVVSSMNKDSKAKADKSLWLGLRINEIDNLSSGQKIDLSRGLPQSLSTRVRSATVYRNGNTAFVAWKTSKPLYGWVEVQELQGLALTDLATEAAGKTGDPDQHPPLKTPEELAINACYQCHPESTLGTSHPVRLYGGRDVRIPDDLPTVDGMLTCVTCHDPHGSDGKMLVREVIKTKLCVTCHYKYKNSSPSTMFQ
jgi:predicted CXXCH cytochrome family protein